MYMYMLHIHMYVLYVLPSPDYNVNFFKQFSLVMNALDNKGVFYTCCFAILTNSLFCSLSLSCV